MSLVQLLKRAVALLVATGLLAASVAGVSADEGDEEVPAGNALQPTQVVAEMPEEYGVLFPLEWGGGSLLHLKGRLATMGCIADTIWVWDNNKWNPYNQYQVPHTLPVIQEFKQTYTDYIPATTIYADCTNICEFQDRECRTFDEQRKRENNYEGRSHFKISPLTDSDSCTTDFNPKVTSQVLPNLPTRPDTCIVTKQLIDGGGVAGVVLTLPINTNPFISVFDDPTPYRTPTEHTDILLNVEIHELCHINQNWHWVQQLQFNFNSDDFYHPTRYLSNSPHGQTFINLVGYKKIPMEYGLFHSTAYIETFTQKNLQNSQPSCVQCTCWKEWENEAAMIMNSITMKKIITTKSQSAPPTSTHTSPLRSVNGLKLI